MSRGFILVDDSLICHSVDNGHCVVIGLFGRRWIAAADCGVHFLDDGADERPEAGIVRSALFGLSGAFPCLW